MNRLIPRLEKRLTAASKCMYILLIFPIPCHKKVAGQVPIEYKDDLALSLYKLKPDR